MVHASVVDEQLRRIGANFRFWNRPELRELPKIIFEGEQIMHVANGRYEGGFAILVATDLRVLLIDKKPLFLTLEDIRYERISDVQLAHRLLDATLRLGALTKDLHFTGYNPTKMREMTSYIQECVMLSRQARQGTMQPAQAPQQQAVESPLQPQPVYAVNQVTQQYSPQVAAMSAPAPVSFAQTQPQAHLQSHATDIPSEAIGQVAVTSLDELATQSAAYEQLMKVMTTPSQPIIEDASLQPVPNPYRTALTFRRRVSRFY